MRGQVPRHVIRLRLERCVRQHAPGGRQRAAGAQQRQQRRFGRPALRACMVTGNVLWSSCIFLHTQISRIPALQAPLSLPYRERSNSAWQSKAHCCFYSCKGLLLWRMWHICSVCMPPHVQWRSTWHAVNVVHVQAQALHARA